MWFLVLNTKAIADVLYVYWSWHRVLLSMPVTARADKINLLVFERRKKFDEKWYIINKMIYENVIIQLPLILNAFGIFQPTSPTKRYSNLKKVTKRACGENSLHNYIALYMLSRFKEKIRKRETANWNKRKCGWYDSWR